jgi:hypothetical protein
MEADDSAIIGNAIAKAVLETFDATMENMMTNGDPIAHAIADLIQIVWNSVMFNTYIQEEPTNTLLN